MSTKSHQYHASSNSHQPLAGTIVDILSQVSKGLAYLHGQWKIAHLDVKPENMYTTGTGIYKLGDLGLACLGNRLAIRLLHNFEHSF